MIRVLTIIIILCTSISSSVAQTITHATPIGTSQADSISNSQEGGLSQQDIEDLTRPFEGQMIIEPTGPMIKPAHDTKDILVEPTFTEHPETFSFPRVDLTPRTLPRWEGGGIYGSSYTSASLLYGYMAAANAGIRHRFNDQWVASAEIGLQKNSIYYNTASFSGQVTWQPSPYFALTAFGAYSPGSFMSPIDIGPSFQWGGYITLQTDTALPFGVDLGARQTYDAVFGHELVPIVQPFVKVGNAKLGIDIGPLIKEATRKNKGGNGNGFSPIPQPIKAVPSIAPRR